MKQERQLNFLEYGQLAIIELMSRLPIDWISAIGGYLGERVMRQAICEDSPWIKQMHINFERLRGIKDADLREQMIIEWTRQIGRVQSEFTVLQRMTREDKIEVIGHENLQNISQPVIFVSCHLANWELVGHVPLVST